MIAVLLKAGKPGILLGTAGLVLLTATTDLGVGRNVSLAPLYILPMMLGAVVLRPAETGGLAILCAFLRACFDTPGSPAEHVLRFVFAASAYFLSGLFVTELVRKHELVSSHLERIEIEQSLRRQAEEQLRFLVASSPAAILTMDEDGIVLAANDAANQLIMTPPHRLEGRAIGEYLPVFANVAEVLKTDVGREAIRTAAECQGRTESGHIFAAHTWFSSYSSPQGNRLAAIIVDSSDELREREEQGLREFFVGNRIVAGAFSHEVRNFCVAMKLLSAGMRDKGGAAMDPDWQAMARLIDGMEAAAAKQLPSRVAEDLEAVELSEVLDTLRIVIEPQWNEIGGTVECSAPEQMPPILAERHGLLQVFMNLAQNSLRAVREMPDKHLEISAALNAAGVEIRFHDSGHGVDSPESLFQAFQPGAAGSGLGLYVSRSIVRSYGGELRYEGSPDPGATFVIELQT